MIQIKGLTKIFNGDKRVLNNLNLKIKDNSIFGLIGINGAGKTTLLRILANVYDQTEGQVLYDGKPNDKFEVKQNIFFLSEDPHFPENTNVLDVVEFYSRFYNLDKEKFYEYLTAFKLKENNPDILSKPIYKFSKGMKRQLYICIALAIAPKYLLLDEAFDGLDPLARLTFKRIVLKRMEEKTMTIIIASHSLRELEDICDSFGLLDNGEIESSGSIEENLNKYHKYQIAFSDDFDINQITEHIKVVSINQVGRVYQLICLGEDEEIITYFESLNPVLLDSLSIDFEELFVIKVENEGGANDEE